MEAVREKPRVAESGQHHAENDVVDVEELAPAPEPFPTDQLAQHRVSSQAITTAVDNLGNVQSSLVHALRSLLPDDAGHVSPHDGRLAQVLTDLLEATYELESLHPSASASAPQASTLTREDVLEHLNHTLSSLYLSTLSRPPPSFDASHDRQDLHPAIHFVHEELVWGRVESLSHAALDLMRSRGSPEPSSSPETDEIKTPALEPPEYTHEAASQLPEYDAGDSQEVMDEKHAESSSHAHGDEKLQRDLDDVYDAIDRLYAVSQRLQDQRVELRATSSKEGRRQMEVRREREKMKELEKIWDLIERTHKGRRTDRQRADVWMDADGAMDDMDARKSERLYEGRQDSINRSIDRDLARANSLRMRGDYVKRVLGETEAEDAEARQKRQAFITDIIARSEASRMVDQDYHMSIDERLQAKRKTFIGSLVDFSASGRLADQDSLPPTPRTAPYKIDDSAEMVSVGDFLRSSPGPNVLRRNRSRSLPLDDVANDKPPPTLRKRIAGLVRRSSATLNLQIKKEPDNAISYIAEHQENLDAVQIMVHGVGMSLKHQYALRTDSKSGSTAHLVCATDSTDVVLTLPCQVVPTQSVTMSVSTLHLEGRLATMSSITDSHNAMLRPPLSASDLKAACPSSLSCASCSRRLTDLRNVLEQETEASGSGFKNLPSEHWSEMMEVWMCHPDPSFTARVVAKSKSGFWPTHNQVLVGNSYVLVHADNLSMYNCMTGQVDQTTGWTPLSCVCGEPLGKQYEASGQAGHGTVRLNKWAIGLVCEGEPEQRQYPLSTYIVSDMLELAQAHATHRFHVIDEESGERRLSMWMFNPSVRISYLKALRVTPTPSPLPMAQKESKTYQRLPEPVDGAENEAKEIRAAKIVYQIYDGSRSKDSPQFGLSAQVEELKYPRDVCDRLIQSLTDSTSCYPLARRTMGTCSVGFLERV